MAITNPEVQHFQKSDSNVQVFVLFLRMLNFPIFNKMLKPSLSRPGGLLCYYRKEIVVTL